MVNESHGVSRVVHHKDFYLRGGDMTVLVENHLYRIHSYFFERESLFFRQKLNANSDNQGEERGSSDRDAYTLEDVKSEDFARFLWVFYNPKYSVYEAPLETWLSILTLSTKWGFDNVKELSVRELEKIEIEAVEKIAIYHENKISRLYLIPSYISICKRDKPLTFNEGMKLGMETVLRIADARERVRLQASESGIRTPTFEDFDDAEVETLIRDVFALGSRPSSPTPATVPNGVNGVANGVIKLGNPPPGNPPKANGATAPRANGGSSAADIRRAGVDSVPSIDSVLSQAPITQQVQQTQQSPQTYPSTAKQERPAPAPLATASATQAATPTLTPTPPPPPPSTDKPKDLKETAAPQNSNTASVMSPKTSGAGEPSSSEAVKDAGSTSEICDVSITNPVVSITEHSKDVTAKSDENEKEKEKEKDKDKENDAEKDDSTSKDDLMSPIGSDTEGGKAKRGQKNKRGVLGTTRGGKKT